MSRPRFQIWLMAALLALMTIAVYWPAMSDDFVSYDDNVVVTSNVHVQNGLTLENVKWAFCNPVNNIWHPLTVLSHMLDCQLFGLKPWGHHLTSVLLHTINTVLIFLLLRNLTGAIWRSVLVAALFGLHPLHVESVAWVAERKDVLSTGFGLLTLICYVRYAENVTGDKCQVTGMNSTLSPAIRHPSRFYWLALFFFALGLMSKPMLVTWPVVMLLLDYWPLRRVSSFKFSVSSPGTTPSATLNPRLSALVFEKWPFFGLAAATSIVTFIVQKQTSALVTVEDLPFGARGGNALISYCRYLGKLFWPVDLAVFYPHPGHWPLEQVVLAGGLLAGITVLFIAPWRQYPFMLMGWVWFVGTLVPVIGLVQVGEQAMADRYTYIPSLGVLILAIWGAYELTQSWRYQGMVLSVAGCLAVVLCLGLTRQQLGFWRDSETLFRHALAVTGDNYLMDNNLGVTLEKKGQTDEAIRQYQITIRLKPGYADAYFNLGAALGRKGQMDEAISQFQKAIRLKPDDAEAYNSLGIALGMKGQMDEATSQFQKAIRLKPDYADAHYNLGIALGMKGQMDEAISQFQEAIRLRPDDAEVYNNLGNAFSQKGQTDEAITQFQEAIRLKPDYAEARTNLARALEMKNTPASR
jgi:tetratricopeptide (TPR) repeat protein